MRLHKIQEEHSLPSRAMMWIRKKATGNEAPDVLRTFLYRPQFFGVWFTSLLNEVMRGPSEWSVGERELFAAFTAKLNQCVF
jgi:hypothetical protein